MIRRTILALFLSASYVSADGVSSENSVSDETQAKMISILNDGLKDGSVTKMQYEQTLKWMKATPCVGIDRTLSEIDKNRFATAIARQFHQTSVDVLESFKDGSWFIIFATAGDGDTPYLFYSQSPESSNKPISMWSGAATFFEAEEINEWALKETPNIPHRLAQCFAWYVTLKANW